LAAFQNRSGTLAADDPAWQAGHAAWQVGWSLQCKKLCWRLTSSPNKLP